MDQHTHALRHVDGFTRAARTHTLTSTPIPTLTQDECEAARGGADPRMTHPALGTFGLSTFMALHCLPCRRRYAHAHAHAHTRTYTLHYTTPHYTTPHHTTPHTTASVFYCSDQGGATLVLPLATTGPGLKVPRSLYNTCMCANPRGFTSTHTQPHSHTRGHSRTYSRIAGLERGGCPFA